MYRHFGGMLAINKITKVFRLNPNYEKRIFGLDLMRSLAIIFVVMGHGGSMLDKANTGFPWIPLLDGVELFFVLSGFLIGRILLNIFQSNGSFGIKTIGNFWVRRWFRTLPNYYLILILNIIVVYFGIIRENISHFNWKFFLFLHNFSGPFTDFFWESWSLSIEEWFYLLFPAILGILYFVFKNFKIKRKQIFLTAVFLFLLTPFLFRVFKASHIDVDKFWLSVKIFKVVIYRLDSIALGLLAAFIKYWHPKIWFKIRDPGFLLGIGISYIVYYTEWIPNHFSTKVFQQFITSVGCFLLLPKFDSLKKAHHLLVKVCTHISLISYSMYLLNLALVAEVINTNFPPQNASTAWGLYGMYWICVLIFSTLLYKYYEKPIMDLRDRWKDCP